MGGSPAKGVQNGWMDIAVNLVESYLRLNGYLTLSEFEVQRKVSDGSYESVTDVDIVGLRFPGAGVAEAPDFGMVLIDDEALHLEPDTVDVIVGEVKEGEAEFNPRIKRPEVLRAVLSRVEWVYTAPLEQVVESLRGPGISRVPACRGAATVRTRLVAFGRSPHSHLHTISLAHIFETMVAHLERLRALGRPVYYKDPAPALLQLLVKTGFTVRNGASG